MIKNLNKVTTYEIHNDLIKIQLQLIHIFSTLGCLV